MKEDNRILTQALAELQQYSDVLDRIVHSVFFTATLYQLTIKTLRYALEHRMQSAAFVLHLKYLQSEREKLLEYTDTHKDQLQFESLMRWWDENNDLFDAHTDDDIKRFNIIDELDMLSIQLENCITSDDYYKLAQKSNTIYLNIESLFEYKTSFFINELQTIIAPDKRPAFNRLLDVELPKQHNRLQKHYQPNTYMNRIKFEAWFILNILIPQCNWSRLTPKVSSSVPKYYHAAIWDKKKLWLSDERDHEQLLEWWESNETKIYGENQTGRDRTINYKFKAVYATNEIWDSIEITAESDVINVKQCQEYLHSLLHRRKVLAQLFKLEIHLIAPLIEAIDTFYKKFEKDLSFSQLDVSHGETCVSPSTTLLSSLTR